MSNLDNNKVSALMFSLRQLFQVCLFGDLRWYLQLRLGGNVTALRIRKK